MLSCRTIKSAIVGTLLAGLAAGTAYAALTPYQQEIAEQLAPLNKIAEKYGLTLRTAADEMVDQDGGLDRTIVLNAGTTYVFAVACDEDCSSVTVQIFDPNGLTVGKRTDDMRAVIVVPTVSGRYRVHGQMICRASACDVGVAMWSN